MPSYTFAPASLRPTRQTPPGTHDALADAAIATADAGGSIEVTPGPGVTPERMINSCRNAVRNRSLKLKKRLAIRAYAHEGKVYLWCEHKSAPRSAATTLPDPPAGDLSEIERRVLRALKVNELTTGDGFTVEEIARAVYGKTGAAMGPQVRAALASLCARRLLLQDRDLRYSVVPEKK